MGSMGRIKGMRIIMVKRSTILDKDRKLYFLISQSLARPGTVVRSPHSATFVY